MADLCVCRRMNESRSFFFSKILRHESGPTASTFQAATQTASAGAGDQNSYSSPPSQESRGTETEEAPTNETHALKLKEAEALVAQLRAENLAQKDEVRVCSFGKVVLTCW